MRDHSLSIFLVVTGIGWIALYASRLVLLAKRLIERHSKESPSERQARAHHHGRHEIAVYVVKGRSQIRWGERLEFAAEVGPGDFVYVMVIRSDNERIVVNLDVVPVGQPGTVF